MWKKILILCLGFSLGLFYVLYMRESALKSSGNLSLDRLRSEADWLRGNISVKGRVLLDEPVRLMFLMQPIGRFDPSEARMPFYLVEFLVDDSCIEIVEPPFGYETQVRRFPNNITALKVRWDGANHNEKVNISFPIRLKNSPVRKTLGFGPSPHNVIVVVTGLLPEEDTLDKAEFWGSEELQRHSSLIENIYTIYINEENVNSVHKLYSRELKTR